jgi:hypothetical protein
MRLPIIDTTKSVQPVTGADAFGDEDLALDWFIAIDCPVYGKSISPVGPFESRDAALQSIISGEF